MKFEFKENFFRFIFPNCLFWVIFIFFDQPAFKLLIEEFFPKDDFLFTAVFFIVFLTSGFIINSAGGAALSVISYFFLPSLSKQEEELQYWRNIDKEPGLSKIVVVKIDRRWDFFTTYVNSTVVVVLYGLSYLLKINFASKYLVLLSLFLLFFYLSYIGFKSIRYFLENDPGVN